MIIASSEHKQDIKNKIIAIGLNSLAAAWTEEDKLLLNDFVQLSIEEVLPTWDLLSDKVRFQVFIKHFDKFTAFMHEQIKGGVTNVV